MIEYQNNFLHTEIGDSGTFCMFTYLDNQGGVKKPRGVQRGPVRSHLHRVHKIFDSVCKIYKIQFAFLIILQKENNYIDNLLTNSLLCDNIYSSIQ